MLVLRNKYVHLYIIKYTCDYIFDKSLLFIQYTDEYLSWTQLKGENSYNYLTEIFIFSYMTKIPRMLIKGNTILNVLLQVFKVQFI